MRALEGKKAMIVVTPTAARERFWTGEQQLSPK